MILGRSVEKQCLTCTPKRELQMQRQGSDAGSRNLEHGRTERITHELPIQSTIKGCSDVVNASLSGAGLSAEPVPSSMGHSRKSQSYTSS